MGLAIELGMHDVLFANWPLPPDVVSAHLPDSLAADTYDGRAWVTVIALENVGVRPRGLPAALGVDVPELNLNAKVTRDGEPGLYYFSVDVGSLLGTLYPRLFQNAPYHYAACAFARPGEGVRFRCRRRHPGSRPVQLAADYGPAAAAVDGGTPSEQFADGTSEDSLDDGPGSLAQFLTDRHRFFTEALDGTLLSAVVSYPSWPLVRAKATIGRSTLFAANGFAVPDRAPVCYYSPGVEAVMSPTEPWERSRDRLA